MPSSLPNSARRRLLSTLALAPSAGLLMGFLPLSGKKPIRQFGKIYNYLKDDELARELGKQRLIIKGADFSGEKFKGVQWQYYDFVDCNFQSNYDIALDWLTNCTFTNCHFLGNFGWGQVADVRFLRCEILGKSGETHFGSDWKTKNLIFEDCTFSNSNDDPNYRCSVGSAGEVMFIGCKGKNFAFAGSRKLTLRNCTTQMVRLGTASLAMHSDKSKMPYSDFLIEDCDLRGGAYMTNAQLNSLVFRRNKVREFQTLGATILKEALFDEIREGYLDLASTAYRGTLTVRNCSFQKVSDGFSFRCGGCIPTHTLIENVVCGRSPADVVSTFGSRKEWTNPPPNKSFIIRNCKIPHLQADWAQTEHLRIENCEFDTLSIRDGRIGKLEIIGGSLTKLDVSRTQVRAQNIHFSEGEASIITDGSNLQIAPE